jgi:hypothetical protein
MQSLVANTILKRKSKVDDAEIVSVLLPFKTDPVKIDAFTEVLITALDMLVLLMYVPCLYRLVYRIVAEK